MPTDAPANVSAGAPADAPTRHHQLMATRAELSSLTSSLSELTKRIAALADTAQADGDADLAHDLFSVERSLTGALRRLARAADGR